MFLPNGVLIIVYLQKLVALNGNQVLKILSSIYFLSNVQFRFVMAIVVQILIA